jgi:hypothetical protein
MSPQLMRDPLGRPTIPLFFQGRVREHWTLLSALVFLGVGCGRPVQSAGSVTPAIDSPGSAGTKDGRWEWHGRDHLSHTVVLQFEERSGRLRQAYTVHAGVPPCRDSLPADAIFLERAIGFWRGVGWNMLSQGQQRAERLPGGFVAVRVHAGDFAGQVLFHEQGGMVFACTQVWMGSGRQFYPSEPLDDSVVQRLAGLAPEPVKITAWDPAPDSLLVEARRYNVVHSLATRPYEMAVFLYNRELQPILEDAEWVILLTRRGICY